MTRPIDDPICAAVASTLHELGYEASDEHLDRTPERVARFLRQWHTVGVREPAMTAFPSTSDELIITKGIRFYSLCAHHGLPFMGTATVGYLPAGKIVGLSKLARIVDHYARRFQVQERLTAQIADAIERNLEPRGVGVILRAEHLCMSMRGIERPGHETITSCMRGRLREHSPARAEFLALEGR